jgi:hypothetical protein
MKDEEPAKANGGFRYPRIIISIVWGSGRFSIKQGLASMGLSVRCIYKPIFSFNRSKYFEVTTALCYYIRDLYTLWFLGFWERGSQNTQGGYLSSTYLICTVGSNVSDICNLLNALFATFLNMRTPLIYQRSSILKSVTSRAQLSNRGYHQLAPP